MTPGHLFCFGFGYTAQALAAELALQGWRVSGTSRAPAGRGSPSVRLGRFDRARPLADPAAALGRVSHVLVSIPPDDAGDAVIRRHGADLAALPGLVWLGYLSTTGVYGDRAGAWVDEETEPAPRTERARRRLAAERAWLELRAATGVPVHVFRLAGIYGPGRNSLEALKGGTARRIDRPDQLFSRIHVADIVQALQASMARPDPGRVYNLCDDRPASNADVVAFAAELMAVEPPPLEPLESAALSEMARSFYAESRRVRNVRLKNELGVRLKFPDYEAGLRALWLDAQGAPAASTRMDG